MAWELVEDEAPERSTLQATGRQAGRALASGVAGAVGGIGDLANLASVGLEKTGLVSPEGGKAFREKTLTTEKVKQGLHEQWPSLKPENEIERFADDVFETLGSLVTPGGLVKGGAKTVAKRTLRQFGLSVGANLGKEVVDQVAGEEGSQAGQYTKAGLLFIGSLINPNMARKEAAKMYKEAENLLPPGANVSAKNLTKQLDSIEHGITKGRPREVLSDAEKFVVNKIDKVRALEQDGRINIEQAVAQKKSLNDDLSNLFPQFGQTGTKTVKNQARRVTRSLNDAIDEYGKSNPQYIKNLRSADEIYGTIAKSQGLADWINRNFAHNGWSRASSLFVHNTIGEVPRMIYKAWKSPEIRKLYVSAIGKAAAEDSREFAKIMDQLENKLAESESKDRWELVD